MSYPFLNREVKTTLRWYTNAKLINRNLARCGKIDVSDTSKHCDIWALPVPNRTVIPFQIRATAGASVAYSWKINDLLGNEVVDMVANLGDLTFTSYANPPRTIIMLEEALIVDDLDTGKYEMVIVTDQGTYYSETFEVVCRTTLGLLANSNLSSGTTNWGYDQWSNLLTGIFTGAGAPATPGLSTTDRRANLTDNLLYTWNGTAWNSSSPANGTYWTTGVGTTWHVILGGGWASAATPPILAIPASPDGLTCWNGTSNPTWAYTPPADELPGYVQITFFIFKNGGFSGSINVYAGSTLLATITNAENGDFQDFTVYMEAGDEIKFVPTSNFDGCLQTTNFQAVSDGTECMFELSWRNCGDLGTVQYEGNEFRNILYLKDTGADLTEPTPVFKLEPETDADGGDVQVRTRKDVDWKLAIAELPWYALDALTEAVNVDDITIRVPYGEGDDQITDLRFTPNWENSKCLAQVEVLFKADEASVGDACCGTFDQMCSGEGYVTFSSSSGIQSFYLVSGSGYWSIKRPNGTVDTYVSGVPEALTSSGTYCAWASDAYGNFRNDAEYFLLTGSTITTLDLTNLKRLDQVYVEDCLALTCADIEGLDELYSIAFLNCALSESCVDGIFNDVNARLTPIDINMTGGTSSAPSSASDAARTEILANGGNIQTN